MKKVEVSMWVDEVVTSSYTKVYEVDDHVYDKLKSLDDNREQVKMIEGKFLFNRTDLYQDYDKWDVVDREFTDIDRNNSSIYVSFLK